MPQTAPTNPHPDVALPPGAEVAGDWGDWDDEPPWRVIYGERLEVGAIVTGAWAGQKVDGSVERNGVHDVYVDVVEAGSQCQRLDLSIAEARQLAAALLSAAATAEGWMAR
jgi:hypothetical protein